jgi:hypothetical protein
MAQCSSQARTLTNQEMELAAQGEKIGNELSEGMDKTIKANEKAGNSFVTLDKKIDSTSNSLGQAARALFS